MAPSHSETQRNRQNDWINQMFGAWQAVWHDLFDHDTALQAAGEFERPDPLPEYPNSDYRLVLGFCHALPETRRACFALFPNDAEMHRRFESHLAGRPPAITEIAARELLADVARHMPAANPNAAVGWANIEIVDRDTPEGFARLAQTDGIATLFERNLLKPVPEDELPAVAAKLFLKEPLYASAGNYYELGNWVTASMFDPARDQIHGLIYRLWNGGWQIMLAEKGVILARHRSLRHAGP